MKAFLILIFYLMLAFGFWLVYEVIWHLQGAKIKAYWGRYMALKEADRLDQELREARILKQADKSRVQEVEAVPVEDLEGWENVFRGRRYPETVISDELIIFEINKEI